VALLQEGRQGLEVALRPVGIAEVVGGPHLALHEPLPLLGEMALDIADLVLLAPMDQGLAAQHLADRGGQALLPSMTTSRAWLASRPWLTRSESRWVTMVELTSGLVEIVAEAPAKLGTRTA
jgi:hypothetical protein